MVIGSQSVLGQYPHAPVALLATKLDPQVVDACERVFREQGFAFGNA